MPLELSPEALAEWQRRAKIQMRKQARTVRASMATSAIAARSAEIVRRLADVAVVRDAASAALFYPMEGKNEVDLRALDATLRSRGARVAYPSVDPDTREMVFRFVADTEAMEERGLGFREPAAADEEATALSVVIVPALCVDARGHRVGYGAGFYDRALPKVAPPAATVIVAFDFQLVAEVPAAEHDVRAEWIVTDARVIEAREDAAGPDILSGGRLR